MTILKLTDRKKEMRTAPGPSHYVAQRIADAAESLSLAGTLAARVELCNEALCKLVELVYQADADNRAANVDLVSLRLLIPVPWGSRGWKRWGLRAHEGLVMRAIMLGRQANWQQGQVAPLFVYDPAGRYWTLNALDHPRIDNARAWLKANVITLGEWRKALKQYQNDAQTLSKRRRNGMRNGA